MSQQYVQCSLNGQNVRALAFENKNRGQRAGPLKWTFVQPQLFLLRQGVLSSSETIMTNADLDRLVKPSQQPGELDLSLLIYNETRIWRGREYVFYRKGFERQLDLPFGDSIEYQEVMPNKKRLIATLDFGKWKDAEVGFYSLEGKPIQAKLKDAYGLGVVDMEKLRLEVGKPETGGIIPEERNKEGELVVPATKAHDQNTYCCKVTFSDDFDPERDLEILDILRPAEWGYFESNGFPLRMLGDSGGTPEIRYSDLRSENNLPDSAGYHGSIARSVINPDCRLAVGMGFPWFQQAGVAAIDQAPTVVEQLRGLMERADKLGDPDDLLRVATEVEQMITGLGPSLEPIRKKIDELKELATGLSEIPDLPRLAPSLEPIQKMIRELKDLATRLSGITELPQPDPPLEPTQKRIRGLRELGAVLSKLPELPQLSSSLEPLKEKIRELKQLATGLSGITELPPLIKKDQAQPLPPKP